jgi:limonene-1,2-epoxide hydrolase
MAADPIQELKARISDLTRELDESPAAEMIPEIEAKLEACTKALLRLEGAVRAEDVVTRFCDAWSRRDVDELLSFFTPDAVYHNVPIDPAVGHDAIRNMLDLFVPASSEIVFEIVHIAASDNVVLTERVDRFQMGERRVELPVMGVFEIREGKIAAWRDYFDMQAWISQTTG